MGHKKKQKLSLHQQAYNKLKSMQAFGDSKHADMAYDREHDDCTAFGKIYSFSAYETYWKHIKYFLKWMGVNHPECVELEDSVRFANIWLQARAEQTDENGRNLSAWTIQTEAAALNKLFQIKPDDPDRFCPPKRERRCITRSRDAAARDKNFSKTNNAELIAFCRGTGLRRGGCESVRGRDLMTREDVCEAIDKYPSLCADALMFDGIEYFVHVKEKGGRERIAPIVGPNEDEIVQRFKDTLPDRRVWDYVNSNADIHGYRADYARLIYKKYARKISEIPYDAVNKGTGKRYQSGVYTCRKDERGRKLDRHAMLLCSKALGHNRLEVVANNYIRGL